MARGYPEPKQSEEPVPAILPEGLCIFCKKRPAVEGGYKCATCAQALRGSAADA